jgi:aminoglycoside 2'-N-acetyltransferase I
MATGEAAIERGRLRRVPTGRLTGPEIRAIQELLVVAFPPGDDAFTEDDWRHATGGLHFMLDLDGSVLAHASVVERELHAGGRPLRTGYVEAVATHPDLQGRGLGTMVMRDATAYIRERFELGALGTDSHHFYERLGWRTWRGPTFVRTATGTHRTPDEDGYILVLATPSSPGLDFAAPLSCDWRPGDAW